MAQKENDGAIYGVKDIFLNGVKLGLISEDGLQPGGDSPSKTRIWAAQKRNAPFLVIKSTPGSKNWTFTMIEMIPDNIIQVNGGTVDEQGVYTAPSNEMEIEGVVDIHATSGHVLRIYRGMITSNFANGFNFTQSLGMACELEMQEGVGDTPAYRIFPPGVTPPEL